MNPTPFMAPRDAARFLTEEHLADGSSLFRIKTPLAEASFSLFGGQILSWAPAHSEHPVLWMSPLACLDGTKAIRGGVPICWPWFGAHPTSRSLPAHGVARLGRWRLDRFAVDSNGVAEFELTLPEDATPARVTDDRPVSGLRLSQTVRIGESMSIALTTRNAGPAPAQYSEGLHTYFAVGDISDVHVEGLDGCDYVDLSAGNSRRTQLGSIAFDGELARLFVGNECNCEIVDRRLKRRIRVEKSGSRSTAVWNPGPKVASGMPDLGPTAWRGMVCVETANALDDAVVLASGESRTLTARYSLQPLG